MKIPDKFPRFAELPVKAGAPNESSWGVFGDDDELGCLNFLSAEGIVDAARLVQKGKVFRLDTRINYAKPPLFARAPARHTITKFDQFGLLGHDDSLDNYNTQEGSQWDGLAHVGHIRHRAFYNGIKSDEVKDGPDGKLGIHKWANRVVGRAVLIDLWKYVNDLRRPIDPLSPAKYPLVDLQGALKAQGTALKPGSIVSDPDRMDAGLREGYSGREGRDGVARRAEGVRDREFQRPDGMALGQSRRRGRHRLSVGRALADRLPGRRRRCIIARSRCLGCRLASSSSSMRWRRIVRRTIDTNSC